MPSNDSRYYARMARSAYTGSEGLLYPQALLDETPVVKTPATEETPAVYYTEADDALTVEEMLDITGVPISYHIESEGGIEQVTREAAYTHVLVGYFAPTITEFMVFAQLSQSLGWNPKDAVLRWGSEHSQYATTGKLPSNE